MNRLWFLSPKKLWFASLGFARDWCFSREFMSLVRGSPALIVVLALVGFLSVGLSQQDDELIRRYEIAARDAVEDNDFKGAEVCFDKLVRLDPEEGRYKYALAALAEQDGQDEEAGRMMARLAPSDETGYGPAHYWLAKQRLKKKELSADDLQFARMHMLRAVDANPGNLDAHAVLSQLYMLQRQPERAAEHLALVVNSRPAARMGLALLYAQLGKPKEANEQARLYASFCAEFSRQNPDNVEVRLNWARSEAMLQNYPQALQILQQGMTSRRDPRYEAAMAGTLAAWSDRIPSEDLPRKLELLQQALTLAPNSPEILQRLAPFALKENPDSEKVRQQLYDVLASGKAQAAVHMILGTIATQEEDWDNALMHLEQAFKQNQRMPSVANNLAWVLAHRDPPDLERALKLADAAVQLAPQSPEIRETRGAIHIRMKNWKAAVTDLESALPGLRQAAQRQSVHEGLAQAYENLGDNALARKHRDLAAEEKTDSKPPPPRS